MRAGVQAGLPLPYRSQAKAVMPPAEELEAVPKGACRAVLMRSRMLRSMCTTAETLPHFGLGLPGYVQVTSPIRRYADLLAHWQIKVLLVPLGPCLLALTCALLCLSNHGLARPSSDSSGSLSTISMHCQIGHTCLSSILEGSCLVVFKIKLVIL